MMRIASWNLWWRHGPWQQRRPAIAATLQGLAPDVCGLQEVWGGTDENFAAELADTLDLYWCWAPLPIAAHRQAEHGADMQIGNAILSRWPIVDLAQLPLPVADAEQQRVALHARIDAPGGVLAFFTTHLTHRADASAERLAQVRELVPFIAAHSNNCAYPPVLTGDLNTMPDSDEIRQLSGLLTAPVVPGLVLVDAWRYAAPGDPGHTWDRRNRYVEQVGLFDARIDYIFVGPPRSERGRVHSVQLAGTESVNDVLPSDHFAVVADLSD